MRPSRTAFLLLGVTVAIVAGGGASLPAQRTAPAWTASLDEVRMVAARIPGRRALRINVVAFAESRRTKNFSVKGAAADPSVQARTAFQLVYADGTVMVDAGMDQQVHKFFGRGVDGKRAVVLGLAALAVLLWSGGFFLRHRIALRDAAGEIGVMTAEQSMPEQLKATLSDMKEKNAAK